jgi:dihydrofolate reductase
MRKIVAAEIVSLDGVVESPDDWTPRYFNRDVGEAIGASMAASDTLLLGRRTYEEFAAVWPERGTDNPIGAWMNNTPKRVVSTTLESVDWQNSELIKGDFVDEITKLKQQPGGNISINGSATLVRSLLNEGLLDELSLIVYPVVRGSGKRLFPDGAEQTELALSDVRRFDTGLLWLTYRPATS